MNDELLLAETLGKIKEQYKAGKSITNLLNHTIKIANRYEQELRCARAREAGQELAGALEEAATETLKSGGEPADNVIFPDFGGKTK